MAMVKRKTTREERRAHFKKKKTSKSKKEADERFKQAQEGAAAIDKKRVEERDAKKETTQEPIQPKEEIKQPETIQLNEPIEEKKGFFEKAKENRLERETFVTPKESKRSEQLSLFGHFFTASVGALGLTSTGADKTVKAVQQGFKQQDAAFNKLLTHTPEAGQVSTSGGVGVKFNGKLNAIEREFADDATRAIADSGTKFWSVTNNAKNFALKKTYLQKLAATAKDPRVMLGILASVVYTSLFWAPNEKGDALTTLTIAQRDALRNGDTEAVLEINDLIQETLDISANIPVIGFIKAELAKFKAAAKASETSANAAQKLAEEQVREEAQGGTDFEIAQEERDVARDKRDAEFAQSEADRNTRQDERDEKFTADQEARDEKKERETRILQEVFRLRREKKFDEADALELTIYE